MHAVQTIIPAALAARQAVGSVLLTIEEPDVQVNEMTPAVNPDCITGVPNAHEEASTFFVLLNPNPPLRRGARDITSRN